MCCWTPTTSIGSSKASAPGSTRRSWDGRASRPAGTSGCCWSATLKGSTRNAGWPGASDSLAVRSFLRLAVDEPPPDHSTISRTRRVIDLESHRAVFTWVQQRLVAAGVLDGKTVAGDATTL